MATLAQPPLPSAPRAEANRQNAQLSTGPRTEEGKARVRSNALKHGLTSKEIFLEPDEAADFEALLADLTKRWCPVEKEEHSLVLALRDAHWRLRSIPALHINLQSLATSEHMELYDEHADNPQLQRAMAKTAGYRTNARLFEQFSRHEGRLERLILATEQRLALFLRARAERLRLQELARLRHEAEAQQPKVAQSEPRPLPRENAPTKQTQPPAPAFALTQPAKPKLDPQRNQELLERAIYGPSRQTR